MKDSFNLSISDLKVTQLTDLDSLESMSIIGGTAYNSAGVCYVDGSGFRRCQASIVPPRIEFNNDTISIRVPSAQVTSVANEKTTQATSTISGVVGDGNFHYFSTYPYNFAFHF
jgi:hypothetical protein